MTQCGCGEGLCTSRIEILKTLPVEKQQQLVNKALHYSYKRGDTVFYEEDTIDSIYIIREGRLKLNQYDAEGKEYILDIRSDGETIGEGVIFAPEISKYNAVCITNTKICEIKRSDLHAVVLSEPELAWNIIRDLNLKLQQANAKLSMLQDNDASTRIIRFLLERNGRVPDHEITLTIDDIAASVGLRKETVSRKLSELEDEGLIIRNGHRKLQVANEENLKKILINKGKLI